MGIAFSLDLYLHTRARVESGNFRTDPYPVPKGYRTHGRTMILTNTARTLADALLFGDDPEFSEWYPKVKEYTFKTFSNRENDRGEWIQIRARDGSPENRVVALPVDDPFHIMRNLLLIIESLESKIKS